jgi:hypothetical protein
MNKGGDRYAGGRASPATRLPSAHCASLPKGEGGRGARGVGVSFPQGQIQLARRANWIYP